MLPEGVCASIDTDSYDKPPIFDLIQKTAGIEWEMMYNTFNMGLGMVIAVDPADVDRTMNAIKEAGEEPYIVGVCKNGEKGVVLC